MTLLGEKVSEPLAPPTSTMCVGTMPAPDDEDPDEDPDEELAVESMPAADAVAEARREPDAEREWVVAAAEHMRTEAMADLEKYMLTAVMFAKRRLVVLLVSACERTYRRLAL
jgi:ABC-type uncharacterized transport system involved in gliding motility auxiliary subunit